METPLVSIVIPSYKTKFFSQSLRSALGQTYENIEVLVYDNCPTEEIREICSLHPSVKYTRNNNTGSLNVIDSLFSGSGEFIKPLFDDDLLHPFCVQRMVEAMETSKDISLAYSASAIINQQNKVTQRRRPFNELNILTSKKMQELMCVNLKNFVGEFSTIMYRKKSILEMGRSEIFRFKEKDYSKGLADVVGFLNLTGTGHACYINEELSYFRYAIDYDSNSNPSYNKNLVYCVTDWVRLLLQSHELHIINDDQLRSAQSRVISIMDEWKNIYPITEKYKQRYLERISSIK